MRIHIGTDHAGLEFSKDLQKHLTDAGHEVFDHGPKSYEPLDDYPSFCINAARAVVRDHPSSRAGPAVRYGIPLLFIVIFSDVAYTCYLNSVYLDAPAYLWMLVTTAIAVRAFAMPVAGSAVPGWICLTTPW